MEIEPRKEWLEAVSEFYRAVLFERELSSDEMEILTTTCDRLQRFHLARLQIEKEGMTFTSDTGVIKTHPLLAVERQAYTGFLSGCKLLELKTPEEKRPAHRPPGSVGDYKNRGRGIPNGMSVLDWLKSKRDERKPDPADEFMNDPCDEF